MSVPLTPDPGRVSAGPHLLFLHGAGGYDDDRPLGEALASVLGAVLDLPRLPDDDMSVPAWTGPIRDALGRLNPGDLVVAHSFGASMLLHSVADGADLPGRVVLLAMPDWGPDGWDVPDYVWPDLAARPAALLSFHHCRDDDVVPLAHVDLTRARLPQVPVHIHDHGGHQFTGLVDTLVEDLRG